MAENHVNHKNHIKISGSDDMATKQSATGKKMIKSGKKVI
jgi:hypothetical protein